MPFTLMREYVSYQESWWKFCGVFDTREGAENAREEIINGGMKNNMKLTMQNLLFMKLS